jgi:hypothetical protein
MPQIENKLLANRLKSLAGELVGLSKNIENQGLAAPAGSFMPAADASDGLVRRGNCDFALADQAERLYIERRRRSRFFPEHLFAEPAWDILLDLFVNGVRNRTISITSACIAGGIPATTGLRWLGVLEKEGLLIRDVSEEDARVTWVSLSDFGMDMMRRYVAATSAQPPLPARTEVAPATE